MGIGGALMVHLARIARQEGCGRFEWAVLDWNEAAIRFYKGLGAEVLDRGGCAESAESGLARLAEGLPVT